MNKRILWNLFQYLLAAGLLGLVLYKAWGTPGSNGLGDLWRNHVSPPPGVERQPVRWEFLAGGFAIYVAAAFLTLVRWFLLVRAQDLPVRLGQAIRLGMIGLFYNTFLPGGVGGDIVKAAGLARSQERRTVAVATVLMDRVIALWGLVWFAALLGGVFWLSGALEGESAAPAKSIVTIAAAIVALSLAIWAVMGLLSVARAERFAERLARIPKVGGTAAEMWRAVWLYRCRQMSVWLTIAISWVCFVGYVTAFYCGIQAFSPSTPVPGLAQHFLIVPIGLVIGTVPLFPGGAGISQLGYAGLYRLFSCAGENGVLASVVYLLMQWGAGLLSFVLYMLSAKRSPEPVPTEHGPHAVRATAAHGERVPTA